MPWNSVRRWRDGIYHPAGQNSLVLILPLLPCTDIEIKNLVAETSPGIILNHNFTK